MHRFYGQFFFIEDALKNGFIAATFSPVGYQGGDLQSRGKSRCYRINGRRMLFFIDTLALNDVYVFFS